MAQPPNRRARRPDSKQMWEESERKAPVFSRERDEPPRRDDNRRERDTRDRGRDDDRDRRRYRSRSPRERNDHRGERDFRDRDGGRNGDYGGGRSRGGGRGRDERDQRGGGRERDDRRDYKGGDRAAPSSNRDRDRRERSRSRNRGRGDRSTSPRPSPPSHPSRREAEVADKPKPRFEEEFTRSRTSTPPVIFKKSTPAPEERMELDINSTAEYAKKERGANVKVKPAATEDDEDDEDDVIVEDDSMADMAAMMGFGGFATTQNKQIKGNDIGAVRKEKKTEYRQYMNRQGGFNRPLSPPRGG